MIRALNHIDFGKLNEKCRNVLKMNENEWTIILTLDVEKTGLDLKYEEICCVMAYYFNIFQWYTGICYDIIDLDSFKDVELSGHCIILNKW